METNYKKSRVVDLRKQLVEVYGYTPKEANAVKDKKVLVELIKSKTVNCAVSEPVVVEEPAVATV